MSRSDARVAISSDGNWASVPAAADRRRFAKCRRRSCPTYWRAASLAARINRLTSISCREMLRMNSTVRLASLGRRRMGLAGRQGGWRPDRG